MSNHTHEATLVSGRVYTLIVPNEKTPRHPDTITFEEGKTQQVTKAVYDRLVLAVDEVTVGSGKRQSGELRPKFEFKEIARARSAPAPTTTPVKPAA